MAENGISGVAIGVTFAGAILAYSGVKGYGVSKSLRALIGGQAPNDSASISGAGGAVTGGGAAPPSGTNNGSTAEIAAFCLNTLGFSIEGTAAAMGNIQEESNFSTTAFNGAEGAIGYCQWEKGRRTALQAYARAHGMSETDSRAQLGYMRVELMSTKSAVYLYMRGTHDVQSAAAYWDQYFEGSSGSTRQNRIANAEQWYGILRAQYGPH